MPGLVGTRVGVIARVAVGTTVTVGTTVAVRGTVVETACITAGRDAIAGTATVASTAGANDSNTGGAISASAIPPLSLGKAASASTPPAPAIAALLARKATRAKSQRRGFLESR
jgi:hypothetical protein